jgi:hypothetical protein
MGSVAGSVLRTGRSSADAERLIADSNRSLRKRNRSLLGSPSKFRILKIHRAETRRGIRGLRRQSLEIPRRRPDPRSLTCGNVATSVSARNHRRETLVTGWGARIRTWEWRNQIRSTSFRLVAAFLFACRVSCHRRLRRRSTLTWCAAMRGPAIAMQGAAVLWTERHSTPNPCRKPFDMAGVPAMRAAARIFLTRLCAVVRLQYEMRLSRDRDRGWEGEIRRVRPSRASNGPAKGPAERRRACGARRAARYPIGYPTSLCASLADRFYDKRLI